MPIYEYRCESCGHTLDALQKLSDVPLTDCPECEAQALKRLVSAPAFRLKGGGWYETDFKSDKEKKRNLAEGAKQDKAEKSDKSEKSDTSAKNGDKTADKPAKTESSKPASKSGTEAA